MEEKWLPFNITHITPTMLSQLGTQQKKNTSVVLCDFSWWMHIESGNKHVPPLEGNANRVYLFAFELSEK